MADLQVIQFNDALQLNGAREIPDLLPRSLEITGPDLRKTVEVLINEEESPSFVVATRFKIIAQVPTSQTKSNIRNISVLSSEFTATFQSRIRFLIGENPVMATGLKAMMQTFLKVLLTTSGTDSFKPSIGGNALKNVGQTFDLSKTSNLISDFTIAVSRTAEQIRSLQAHQPRLSDDERLLQANLLNVRFEPAITTLVARVELIAQSGLRAITNLEL
jgi:hypothetical protein